MIEKLEYVSKYVFQERGVTKWESDQITSIPDVTIGYTILLC